MNELFGELEFPIIRDYLAGLESYISTRDLEKCRVLRGRPDALYGNLVVEFEAEFPRKLKEAKGQLRRFLAILRRNAQSSATYFMPIATDGISFRVFAPIEGASLSADQIGDEIEIEQIEEFDLARRTPAEFYYWLDRHFIRREKRSPKAESFLDDFGTTSAAYREASARWLTAVHGIRDRSDFKVIYENWRKYLRIAYGSEVGDEHLFVRHTFLATLAKLLAFVRITGTEAMPPETEVLEVIHGTFFENKRILNFLEEDFFSWVARDPVEEETIHVSRMLLDLLLTYNLRELSEDVMKELYQRIVAKEERHGLGEYYTPDWLAALMCEKLLSKSGDDSVLDPACGSGTFLYQAIQHKRRRLPDTSASLETILGKVVGIDIHPLAVIVSKMNVLLALGDLFQKRRGAVSIQVYLANSIRHSASQTVTGTHGEAAERVELNHHAVLMPTAVLTSTDQLDLAVRIADTFAKAHRNSPVLDRSSFDNLISREAPKMAARPGVIQMLFDLSATFHEFIRRPEDTIWAYILKNQYKPTFLRGQFDVIIGNPPWLSFRYVERGEYQTYLKDLIVNHCRLLSGAGHLITHLELGTLFFVRCADLYLKPGGKIGFVLPRSIFTADQHDRFRQSMASGNTTLTEIWDLEDVTPLFNVPAAVAFGDRESEARKTLPGKVLTGEISRRNASLGEARPDLKIEDTHFYVVQQGKRSYFSTSRKKISGQRSFYQPYFKEGATIVPRNFWFVEIKADPRLGLDPTQPLVSTDPRAEAQAKEPYKGTFFEGPVEAEFLYATLLSTDLLPFGHFGFRPVVLPLLEDEHGYSLIASNQARAKGYLRLADWLDRAQITWDNLRKEKAQRGNALEWLNYRNKLTDQDPKAKYVVLYPKSATFLCAAAVPSRAIQMQIGHQQVPLKRFVADHVTYCFETEDRNEASYLVGLLNSPTVDALIKPMQARGLWGPRDIHKKVWELPIPEFDSKKRQHSLITEIVQGCEDKIAEMLPALRKESSIGRARSAVRKALSDELAEIDNIVREIFKSS